MSWVSTIIYNFTQKNFISSADLLLFYIFSWSASGVNFFFAGILHMEALIGIKKLDNKFSYKQKHIKYDMIKPSYHWN